MLLTVDMGNIHIVWGVYRQHELLFHWRTTTGRHQTTDEFRLLLERATGAGQLPPEGCTDAVVASVVPTLTGALVTAEAAGWAAHLWSWTATRPRGWRWTTKPRAKWDRTA
ncbi:MAG: type III pantothenate kinase [Bacillota bacterium]|nr:type III pantothenate kinase [Bacillota bacterium]